MEHGEPGRRHFFRYKVSLACRLHRMRFSLASFCSRLGEYYLQVLEDAEVLQRAREHGSLQPARCLDCCSCASLPRCLSLCRFFFLFSTSLFLAMVAFLLSKLFLEAPVSSSLLHQKSQQLCRRRGQWHSQKPWSLRCFTCSWFTLTGSYIITTAGGPQSRM